MLEHHMTLEEIYAAKELYCKDCFYSCDECCVEDLIRELPHILELMKTTTGG